MQRAEAAVELGRDEHAALRRDVGAARARRDRAAACPGPAWRQAAAPEPGAVHAVSGSGIVTSSGVADANDAVGVVGDGRVRDGLEREDLHALRRAVAGERDPDLGRDLVVARLEDPEVRRVLGDPVGQPGVRSKPAVSVTRPSPARPGSARRCRSRSIAWREPEARVDALLADVRGRERAGRGR